jgi:hypothetical protein
MNIKKTEEEIMKRIEFIEGRLNVLENALKQAMEKPFFERGKQIIRFIYIEKKVYTALDVAIVKGSLGSRRPRCRSRLHRRPLAGCRRDVPESAGQISQDQYLVDRRGGGRKGMDETFRNRIFCRRSFSGRAKARVGHSFRTRCESV